MSSRSPLPYLLAMVILGGLSIGPAYGQAHGVRTHIDTTRPEIHIVPPPNHAIVRDTATVTAVATDDVGVAGVRFICEGKPIGDEITSPPWSVFWDARGLSEGTHVLEAIARDAAGNRAVASTVVWILHEEMVSVERDLGAASDEALLVTTRPISGRLELRIDLERDADVTAELFDILGRRLSAVELGNIPAGSRMVMVDDVPGGTAVYRVRGVVAGKDVVVVGRVR